MNRYSSLMKRVKDGECILIDGATGTEVERKGVPQGPYDSSYSRILT